jgi:hypothetical protein
MFIVRNSGIPEANRPMFQAGWVEEYSQYDRQPTVGDVHGFVPVSVLNLDSKLS